jgi:nucleotide-binding universal stress UspA family protein
MARIMVAYDGSDGARRALQRVPVIARDGDVVALVGVEPPIPGGAAKADDPDVGSNAVAAMRAAMDEAVEFLAGKGINASVVQLNGHVHDEIVQAAEAGDFDLLVVGSRNERGLRRMLLGSTTTKIAQDAPCDVYIVH